MKMDLFNSQTEKFNILPYDGEVYYYGKIVSTDQAQQYFEKLWHTVAWENDELMMFGKKIITKRKVAWYGSKPFDYTYSKITKTALPWTPEMLEILKKTEQKTGETYNSCLLNLYHSGAEGMSWDSDAEKDLKKEGAIASLSFGAERKFAFKHRQSKQTVSQILENGSLLLMKGLTQAHWLHRLPPTKSTIRPRINLTFRTVVEL